MWCYFELVNGSTANSELSSYWQRHRIISSCKFSEVHESLTQISTRRIVRLGLDIGTNSIGWWLYETDGEGSSARIVRVIDGGGADFL